MEPKVKLYVAERSIIPYSTEIHRRDQGYKHILGSDAGENVDDYWNVDEHLELSDTWTGFTRFIFLNEKPPDGFSWSRERPTRKPTTSRPDTLWPEILKETFDASKRKEKQKWAIEQPKLDQGSHEACAQKLGSSDASFSMLSKIRREKYRVESTISVGATEKLPTLRNLAQTFPHGPMIWKIMRSDAWNDM